MKGIGLTPPMRGWLGDPNVAIWMLLIVAAWQYTGFMMVLVLAGLQGVPNEIYQAAALDGARGIRAFWYITLPSIRNILIVAVLITTIGAFKVVRPHLRDDAAADRPTPPRCSAPTSICRPSASATWATPTRSSVVLLIIARHPRLAAASLFAAGMMAKLLRFRVLSLAMYAFVGVYSLFVLLPLAWMVFAAFKTKREIFIDPLGLPDTLSPSSPSAAPGAIGLGIFHRSTRRW